VCSLASKLFGKSVYNDNILLQLRHENAQPVWDGAPYELIILDELQDMTDNLYWLAYMFAINIARRQGKMPRLLVLGDPRQAIYEFRGADAQFLEQAEHTFKDINPYPWQNLKLSQSFRLSHQTTNFVNGFIGEKYIEGSHDGPKPIYMHIDLKNRGALLDAIRPLIEKYTPERSAILAPSIQTNKFLPMITNELTEEYGIPIAVPIALFN
jgi:superfamily I DNA/RNA helicase